MASNRPTISGTRHVIAAGHYLAAHAGFQILEAGGNAVDAGVCAGICIGVLQTEKVSFGGVAPMIIYRAEDRKLISIDGLGVWPKAITPDYFVKNHGGKIPPGVHRTVVPAAQTDAWLTALEHYGTMSFGEVAAAAVRFASQGFPMYPLMAEFIAEKFNSYNRWPSSAANFLPNGKPPVIGELFVQADLGRSIQYMIDEEKAASKKGRAAGIQAARDAFYKGDIARKIVKFHEETGGLMRMEDLAEYRVRFEPTVKSDFHGIEVHACGAWCQGPTVPIALNLLKGYDLKGMGHNSPEYIHTLTEAFKLAFSDRHHYIGDPRFVNVPLEGLLSDEYATERRRQIREAAWPEMPPPGKPKGSEGLLPAKVPAPQPDNVRPGDTSYLCVIDSHGNAMSCTPSDGSDNAPIVPGCGFVASGRGTQSWADPDHPCSVAPGKRPRLTPNPALALKNGKALMPFGTPGGDVQCQSMIQVFLNVNVFGMDVQSAIEAPRFSTYSFPGSFEPHPYFPGLLMMEGRIANETGEALAQRGHRVEWWDEWTWLAGAPCAIFADHERGILHGGADPRRPAYVLGW